MMNFSCTLNGKLMMVLDSAFIQKEFEYPWFKTFSVNQCKSIKKTFTNMNEVEKYTHIHFYTFWYGCRKRFKTRLDIYIGKCDIFFSIIKVNNIYFGLYKNGVVNDCSTTFFYANIWNFSIYRFVPIKLIEFSIYST